MSKLNLKMAGMIVLFTAKREVGRTSLNKLLFFADLAHYLKMGTTITGSDYIRMQFGPVPQNIEEQRQAVIDVGYLEENSAIKGEYTHYTYSVRKGAININKVRDTFSGSELDAIDTVTQKLSPLNATALSELSHRFEPWIGATSGQILDLERAKYDKSLLDWMKVNRFL